MCFPHMQLSDIERAKTMTSNYILRNFTVGLKFYYSLMVKFLTSNFFLIIYVNNNCITDFIENIYFIKISYIKNGIFYYNLQYFYTFTLVFHYV